MSSRILNADPESEYQKKLLSSLNDKENLNTRVFYFGQVIFNNDPDNLNRLKIRIPIVDDILYLGNSKEEGDENLPWAVGMSTRFIDTPEVNSIVLVALFDTKVPQLGRIYFNSFSDLSIVSLFERLDPENNLLSNLGLIEDIFHIRMNFKPKQQNEFDGTPNVKSQVGIRGKGKNKIIFDEDSTLITQNENSKESKLKMTKDIDLESSNILNLTSKKGNARNFHPVFDQPTFELLTNLNLLLVEIVTILTIMPALSPAGPCIISPIAVNLPNTLALYVAKFQEYILKGSSKKLNIN